MNKRITRKVRAIAKVEVNGNGNGNGNGKNGKNGKNAETWTKVTSLAHVGALGLAQGTGKVSQAKFAIHLCKMASMGILSGTDKSDDAKHHWNEFKQRNNEGTAGFEKAGDANKASQFKNFLKLGEMGGKVNGEGFLAKVQAVLTKQRNKTYAFGDPRPKQTFVAYLECAKAQLKVGNGRELTEAEIVTEIMPKESDAKSQRDLVQDAIADITKAVNIGGAPKALAELAKNLQRMLPKLAHPETDDE